MDFNDLIKLIITIGGWCMTLGLYIGKIKQHDIEIKEIKTRQNTTDEKLSNILKTLTELNTKVGLLIDSKIKMNEE